MIGCHNINFVTPSHVVPQILEAMVVAIGDGLRLPIVYNTSAYDSLETLRLLDGVVDIYMPDFKCWEEETARRYLNRPDYPSVAKEAIREMHRQVGDLCLDDEGVAERGLLVRHLVMPGQTQETEAILRYLARQISTRTFVNIMDQYRPAGAVDHRHFAGIDRRPTRQEIMAAFRHARAEGLTRFDGEWYR
jgi:putative pyruvate formate lyase activating enzyme